MGWADSATGGGYGGGGSSSRGGGGGGYSGGFGGQVDTGGVSPGQGGGGGGTSLGNEVGTKGQGKGYGAGHNSTDAAGGGSNTSRASQATQTRAEQARERAGGLYDSIDTPGMMDSVTNGAIASFDDAAPTAKGFMGQLDATPQTHDQAMADMQDDVHGGVVGKIGSALGAVTGMPGVAALGQVGQSVVDGFQASERVGHYNDMTGASLDTSVAGNIGEQGARSLAGMVGSRAGSSIGAMTGTPIGALAGGLLGSSMAQNAVSQGTAQGGASAPGVGSGEAGSATMGTSSGASSMTPQVATQQPSVEHGPVDFDGYASYASMFFA